MHASVAHLADLDQGQSWRAAPGPQALAMTPLHEAVLACAPERVAAALRAGCPVDQGMSYGFTALHLAAAGFARAARTYRNAATVQGWTHVIDSLLNAGADPAARDWQNRIPMALSEGFAPENLRQATAREAAAERFYSANDGVGPGKRAGTDCLLRNDGKARSQRVLA